MHVTGKDHQFGTGVFDHAPDTRLLRGFVVGVEGEVVIRDTVPLRQRLQVRVIGDHGHHVHRQLPDALAIQQIVQAVVGLGHHDQHFGPVMRRGEFEGHAEGLTALAEPAAKGRFVKTLWLTKFDPDKEPAGTLIVEGMVLSDIALVFKQVTRHGVDRAQPAGAIGGENPGVRGAAHEGLLLVF
ncbi:hypothetical protein PLUA15_40109 [Pseudomonas lundensis]|uniref:Uncharacterized protein n=1 Tax=Pseudomonas lundensis TaxID=86185 RepID=A0AAX2HAE4_9PSED|nr:hypothetical protein PLUA15_40109 [Pseudomonas lundensis]